MHEASRNLQVIAGLMGILILVTSVVLFAQQIPPTNADISKGQTEGLRPQDTFSPSYVTHDPITITSNADFAAQGFPGSGTPEVPYVIAGYNITTTETCISIQDTDAYFVIRYCFLTGGSSGHGISGIKFHNVTHGETRNNTISQKDYGVYLSYSSNNNTVVNNTISGSDYGVHLYYGSRDNVVVNNTILGNLIGVFLYRCYNNTLSSNIMVNNGVLISGNAVVYWQHNITADNLVNGKQLGYFWNSTGGIIDGTQYGQMILANCTGMTVENGVFSNASAGFLLGYSSYCSLINSTLSGNYDGVRHTFSSNNTLMNNTISGNDFGVYFYYSSNNTIVNNTIIENSDCGVYLGAVSEGNLIYLNVIAYNAYENAHDSGTNNHWNSTGMGNYWSDYNGIGVYYVTGPTGPIDYHPFMYPPDTTPPIIDHPADVSYEEGTTDNFIFWTPSDTHPFHYVIYRNGTEVASASWDWIFIGINIDGLSVGVYNYTIVVYDTSGNHANDTVFVTVIETIAPTIDQPADMNYVEGTTGNTVTWTPSDAYPSHYMIYRNGTEVVSDSWDGSSITVEVDGLSAGVYNYTIMVYDTSGNSISDTVLVTVVETMAPTIDHPADMDYEEGTTGNTITWSPSDAHPSHHVVYRNGTEVASGNWDGSSITVNVDGLSVGVYNYTIVVYDTSGNCASDTVLVTVVDTIAPTIDHPADMDYEEGTTGSTITWNPSDTHPAHYVAYRNGTEVASGNWDGSSIAVNVDGLSVGVYNYTIVVYDTSGNMISDTVIVTVLPLASTSITTATDTTTTTTTTTSGDVTGLVIAFLGVGAVGVIAIVLILMRHRRGSMTES